MQIQMISMNFRATVYNSNFVTFSSLSNNAFVTFVGCYFNSNTFYGFSSCYFFNCTIIAQTIVTNNVLLMDCVTTGEMPELSLYSTNSCIQYYSFYQTRPIPIEIGSKGIASLQNILSILFFVIGIIVLILLIVFIIYLRYIRKSPIKAFNGFIAQDGESTQQDNVFNLMVSHQNGDYLDIVIEDAIVTDPFLDQMNNAKDRNRVNQGIEEKRRAMRNEANLEAMRRRSSTATNSRRPSSRTVSYTHLTLPTN